MRYGFNLLVPVMALIAGAAFLNSQAQTPTYNLGRTATQQEIKAWDISIGPEGKELPPGSGTAKEGTKIYAQKCAVCHGPTGEELYLIFPQNKRPLVGGKGTLTTTQPVTSIGSYWPFATAVWDYINRAMPATKKYPAEAVTGAYDTPATLGKAGLSADEVYALTAFLLYRNGIIQESDVMDAKSLPKIRMPNRDGFFPAKPEWKRGYYQPYFEPQLIPRKRMP